VLSVDALAVCLLSEVSFALPFALDIGASLPLPLLAPPLVLFDIGGNAGDTGVLVGVLLDALRFTAVDVVDVVERIDAFDTGLLIPGARTDAATEGFLPFVDIVDVAEAALKRLGLLAADAAARPVAAGELPPVVRVLMLDTVEAPEVLRERGVMAEFGGISVGAVKNVVESVTMERPDVDRCLWLLSLASPLLLPSRTVEAREWTEGANERLDEPTRVSEEDVAVRDDVKRRPPAGLVTPLLVEERIDVDGVSFESGRAPSGGLRTDGCAESVLLATE
jgi:hypothetical protein